MIDRFKFNTLYPMLPLLLNFFLDEAGISMVNQEHFALLGQGVLAWNAWKKNYSDRAIDLRGVNLKEANLTGIDLSQVNLSDAVLKNANLTHANLMGANLSRAVLLRSDLSDANLGWSNLSQADLRHANLEKAILTGANFLGAQLRGANFQGVNLRGSNLRGSDLSQVNLSQANLSQANLSQANLSGQDLRRANLSQTNLSQANLKGMYLSYTNLKDADLSGAFLSQAFLMGADLRGADLRGAFFKHAILSSANLSQANLSQANLSYADFSQADLTDTNLISVVGLATNFVGAILTGACIQNWQINSATRLDGVLCDYVYLQKNQEQRCPPVQEFAPGEFTNQFQKVRASLEFVFSAGIEWQAFLIAFQNLQIKYSEAELSIQAFEVRSEGTFAIRLYVASDTDLQPIQQNFDRDYQIALAEVDRQYRNQFPGKDEEISAHRLLNTDLLEVVKIVARHSQFL